MCSESCEFLEYTLIDIGPDLFIGSHNMHYYDQDPSSDFEEDEWDVINDPKVEEPQDDVTTLHEKDSMSMDSMRNALPEEERNDTDNSDCHQEHSTLKETDSELIASHAPAQDSIIEKENTMVELTSPMGERWAICDPSVDLSGSYVLKVDDEFYQEYEEYLSGLGIGYFIRKVALQVINQTAERIEQSKDGKKMRIIGTNPKGEWDRTFISSGSDYNRTVGKDSTPDQIEMKLANGEDVYGEAWWEDNGTVHRSFLRGGGASYGGGDFESKRYFDENGVYICESLFHPIESEKKTLAVTWKFVRSK